MMVAVDLLNVGLLRVLLPPVASSVGSCKKQEESGVDFVSSLFADDARFAASINLSI